MTLDTPTQLTDDRTGALAFVLAAGKNTCTVRLFDMSETTDACMSDGVRRRGVVIRPGQLVLVRPKASQKPGVPTAYEVLWRGPTVATVAASAGARVTYDTGYTPARGVTKTVLDARPADERQPLRVGQQIVFYRIKDDPDSISLVDIAVDGVPLHPDRLSSHAVARTASDARAPLGSPSMTPEDAGATLAQYTLGDLIALEELPFRAHNAPFYRVETTHGRYFLKRYRDFTPSVDRGLDLIVHLHRHGYPAIAVQLSANRTPHVSHGGSEVALFEYLDLPEDWTLTPARAAALGEALGSLHALADGFPLPNTFLGHDEFPCRLRALPARPWMPGEAQETLAWMSDAFPTFRAADGQPRGACHVEFGLEHVRLIGDTVYRVFDWDIVGTDCLFHDLGTTLSEAVHSEGIDFAALAAIVCGYEQRRPLTPWERSHLYEATCYGTCKYLIWELEPAWLDRHELPLASLRKVASLRTLGKAGFDARLAGEGAVTSTRG